MKRLAALLPLIALVLLAAVFAAKSLWRDTQVETHAMVGKPLPAVMLPGLDGAAPRAVKVGKGPYLVNFFASWCPPCIVEHPALMALEAEGVTIVGVAYKDDPANSRAFLAERGDPFATVLVDRDGRAGMEFGVTGPPETYLVSSDGIILAKHIGELDDRSIRTLLSQAR
ncbi:DsbE family thiol:disulfide interchange protein [Caulobacter sp. NIBR1757]|uniref:DsbE family thiol:disulfide interchange protein n=1 Tax=Caulobacter sp. NIBR1757 TaxID=3016000 RepID=UPI0022F13C0C|nr:DsbE family thiol:disulfide interchange protein [Caulobacter sp. NIBR1757]WGM37404.1 Thiol:disulfide interchange protein DsbE [Caulobacter sp. NIBR1757]